MKLRGCFTNCPFFLCAYLMIGNFGCYYILISYIMLKNAHLKRQNHKRMGTKQAFSKKTRRKYQIRVFLKKFKRKKKKIWNELDLLTTTYHSILKHNKQAQFFRRTSNFELILNCSLFGSHLLLASLKLCLNCTSWWALLFGDNQFYWDNENQNPKS